MSIRRRQPTATSSRPTRRFLGRRPATVGHAIWQRPDTSPWWRRPPGAVGFVAAGPCAGGVRVAGEAEIHGLHLRPERWGQGLGRLLLESALARLRERGFRECIVWVLRENARGRGFYVRLGWRRDGAEEIDRQAVAVVILRYRRLL